MSDLPFGKLIAADDYAGAYLDGYGFEAVCATARQQRNATFIAGMAGGRILEVGCGPLLLADVPGVRDVTFTQWTIVEPASGFAAGAERTTAADPRFVVIRGFLEERSGDAMALAPEGYDAAIVSGLLNETTEPLALLRSVVAMVKRGGKLLASVPNAMSFHRLLAVECGLIGDPHELSAIDRKLGHPVVFDRASLEELLRHAGLEDLVFDGYLFKPFTNAQMEQIVAQFGGHLVDGLIRLGRHFPDHAAEICIVGTKP